MAPAWLLQQERALYVEGIGHLDQYGSYVDSVWEKGIVHFMRDMLLCDIEERVGRGDPMGVVRPLIERLNALNSDILQWEQHGGRITPN